MAGKTSVTMVTIRDDENAIEQAGFTGTVYTVACDSAKTARDVRYHHVARNWDEESWGNLPTNKEQAIKLYFTVDGEEAQEQIMPNGTPFTPDATYNIVQVPFVGEERAQKMVAAATKGLIKTKAPKAKKGVGSRA
jgi:hypothetical protein